MFDKAFEYELRLVKWWRKTFIQPAIQPTYPPERPKSIEQTKAEDDELWMIALTGLADDPPRPTPRPYTVVPSRVPTNLTPPIPEINVVESPGAFGPQPAPIYVYSPNDEGLVFSNRRQLTALIRARKWARLPTKHLKELRKRLFPEDEEA